MVSPWLQHISGLHVHVFWDMTPCRLLTVSRRFGGAFCLYLHDLSNLAFLIDVDPDDVLMGK